MEPDEPRNLDDQIRLNALLFTQLVQLMELGNVGKAMLQRHYNELEQNVKNLENSMRQVDAGCKLLVSKETVKACDEMRTQGPQRLHRLEDRLWVDLGLLQKKYSSEKAKRGIFGGGLNKVSVKGLKVKPKEQEEGKSKQEEEGKPKQEEEGESKQEEKGKSKQEGKGESEEEKKIKSFEEKMKEVISIIQAFEKDILACQGDFSKLTTQTNKEIVTYAKNFAKVMDTFLKLVKELLPLVLWLLGLVWGNEAS